MGIKSGVFWWTNGYKKKSMYVWLGLCAVSAKSEERSNKTIRTGESRGNEEANKDKSRRKEKSSNAFLGLFLTS